MTKKARDEEVRSAMALVDLPIFVVCGLIVGYIIGVSLDPTNTISPQVGAALGAILFFFLALVPIIRLTIQEQRKDKGIRFRSWNSKKEEGLVRDTLFTDQQKTIEKNNDNR